MTDSVPQPASGASQLAAAPDDVRARHAALAEEVDGHRQRYHNLDAPTISDGEYDALMRELQGL
jgi:DNA ligase (NAD+)